MSRFSFPTDRKSEQYCWKIIHAMVRSFGISQRDALRRVNVFWKGLPFVGDRDLGYHRVPAEWAKRIFEQTSSRFGGGRKPGKPRHTV
jgi:hypothetical protein